MLDNELLESLLVEKGFPRAEVEAYTDRKPNLWQRLSSEKNRYLHFLRMVSYDFARHAGCIIVGRGGQVLFGAVPGVIRVRVVAPLQDRVKRARGQFGNDERQALQAIQHIDNERAGFYRVLLQADWNSPDLYDLIINTHLVSLRTAADLIEKTLGSKEVAARQKEASRKVADLYLAEKAMIAILFEEKLPIHSLQVEVEKGTVTLRGTARDHPSIERCREMAAGVFSLSQIDNEIRFEPKYVEMLAGIHRGA